LTDAEVLPVSYGGADVGRITKGAVLALHAKVAMYEAKWVMCWPLPTRSWVSDTVLFSKNFEQVFRVTNENSTESVFEIQCAIVQGNPSASEFTILPGSGGEGILPVVDGVLMFPRRIGSEFENRRPKTRRYHHLQR